LHIGHHVTAHSAGNLRSFWTLRVMTIKPRSCSVTSDRASVSLDVMPNCAAYDSAQAMVPFLCLALPTTRMHSTRKAAWGRVAHAGLRMTDSGT
jgi:hypothetical protein